MPPPLPPQSYHDNLAELFDQTRTQKEAGDADVPLLQVGMTYTLQQVVLKTLMKLRNI